ncbi:tryptophan dimethylallyltransferase-domain-containing protein [Echria macrotheca]|uniref:Tryptophan dimethylallyltransferase-domain-containing protein n=1 Tax=Echria macrotheca TaxID=438768 RepID=A0AAJ0B596_9PEZI|nr:tryptophan dimethylallyltransferase-domain-containing protein [Echria macrotheca]
MVLVNGTSGATKAMVGGSYNTTQVWKTLSQYLPSRDPDSDFWWKFSGLHLALMLEEAEYPPEKQIEALVFFYHWTAPYLGSAPSATGKPLKWKSMVQPDGTPIKYSWRWPLDDLNGPEVRYNYEAIGPYAGTDLDPLCQLAAKDLMGRLASAITDAHVNNTWFNHFMSTMFEHDNTKLGAAAAQGLRMTSSVLMATEFNRDGIIFKSYIQPRLIDYTGVMPADAYEKAMAGIEADSPARAAVHDFLSNSDEGQSLTPFSIGVDNKDKSRLKWYFSTPRTSFASVRSILTLDGRIQTPHTERQLADLDELVKSVLGLPDDFPADQHPAEFLGAKSTYSFVSPTPANPGVAAPVRPTVPPRYPYYFDVAPRQKLPGVKWNLPVRHYDRDDLSVAKALTAWMEKQGHGAWCDRYMKLLERLAAERGIRLRDSRGLQEFISIMLKPDGEIDVTSCFSAHAFGVLPTPDQLSYPRRGTRRRGDDDY